MGVIFALGFSIQESYAQAAELVTDILVSQNDEQIHITKPDNRNSTLVDVNPLALFAENMNITVFGKTIEITREKIIQRTSDDFTYVGSTFNSFENVWIAYYNGTMRVELSEIDSYVLEPFNDIHIISRYGGGVSFGSNNEPGVLSLNPNYKKMIDSAPVGTFHKNTHHDIFIDVIYLYTDQAEAEKGQSGIRLMGNLGVDKTNDAFTHARIPVQLRHVETSNVDKGYVESGLMATELNRLINTDDDYMKRGIAVRDKEKADVGFLFLGGILDVGYCGRASGILPDADSAFAAINVRCKAHIGTVIAHEFGHLGGAYHDYETNLNQSNNTIGYFDKPFSYGHGYTNKAEKLSTIMAYPCTNKRGEVICDWRNTWSNPSKDFERSITVAGTEKYENTALVLLQTAPLIASFKGDNVTYVEKNTTPPTLASISNIEISRGATKTIPVSATDPEKITLTLVTAPSWVSLNDKGNGSGVITINVPTTLDKYSYTVTVKASDNDGSVTRTFTVTISDTAPSISDISDVTLKASQTKTVSITATDAESDPITLTLQVAPSFAKITHNGNGKATITLNPDSADIGTHTVTVQAVANGKSDTESFTVTVTRNTVPSDTPPVISPISNISLTDSQTLSFSVTATDKEGDTITLSLSSSLGFVTLTGNTISINPTSSDVGIYTVTVQAVANGKTDTESFTITVSKTVVDTAPVISEILDMAMTDSQTRTVTVTATDTDGDTVSLSLQSSPNFVSISGNIITVKPSTSDVGTHTVTVKATANGKSDTESFEITVIKTAIDVAPIISEIVDISMTDSQTRTVTVTATDPDGDTISLSLQSAPRFVSITGDTITIKPNMSDIGTHTVTVQAVSNGKTDTESFTVTVSQTIVDSPPVLTPQPDITLNHTETKTLAVTATDPDGDTITVSLASYTPDFVTIQSVPGNYTILIKPALSDVGTHDIGIYADANGKRAVDVFKITILEEIIDAAPVISTIPNVSMFDSHTRAVTVTASDREGDTITLSLQSAPDFVTLLDNIIAIKPAKTDIGTYTVTVQATANDKSDTQSFKVIVAKRVTFDTGPVMQTIPDITMIHTQTETLTVTVTDKENDIITMSLARYAPDFVTLLDKGGGKGTITINPDPSDVGVHYVGVFAYANGLFAGNTVRVAVTNVQADTVPPVFSNIPADIIQSTSSNKTLVTFVPPTATDDTDGTIQVISSHKSGILFPIGNTTVTFTATDSAGNKSIHNMVITITKAPPAAPPVVLFHDTFDGTLDSWTYKEIPYTPWIKTDCDTQNNNAYTLLYSTEHNGSAHLNYTAQCWFGMAGANKTITIPESQKDHYLQISLDHRSLADMRHYANVGNVNNHFMSITDSDGLIIQYVTLFQGESHDTIQDSTWRQKSIMLSPTEIARCPCDVFVYVSDYWRIPWKQQGYIDNVEMKFVQGVTGTIPEIQNSLTIDEFTQAVFANGTKVSITGKYVTDDTVLVSWEAFADATQYKAVIVLADTQAKTVHKKITNTLYEFTGLEPDTAYTIKVMVADDPSTKSVITATTLDR